MMGLVSVQEEEEEEARGVRNLGSTSATEERCVDRPHDIEYSQEGEEEEEAKGASGGRRGGD